MGLRIMKEAQKKRRKPQTREELLKNLARARAIKQQKLSMRRRSSQPQRSPQRRVRPQSRFVRVPREIPIINPQLLVNPDLDVTRTDVTGSNESINSAGDLDVTQTKIMAKENISSGEGLFHSLDDVMPKILQRRR